VSAIRATDSRAHAKAALCKVQTVPYRSSDSIKWRPSNVFLADSSLQHQVFNQSSDGVVRERRDDRCVHSKAAPEPACDVVFASALPCAELPRCGNALITRIKAQHHFTQADQIPHAIAFRFDL
jgi:hypothetical protein